MPHLREYSEHYSVLALGMAAGLAALVFLRFNSDLQQIVLWSMVGGYLLWGIGHHLLRKDLTWMIVLEYFLVALIAGLLIQATLIQK